MKNIFELKSKSALQSSLVFSVLTFLQPGINFFLLPLYLKILSPEEYGIYTLLLTITSLIASIGGLKISGAIIPFYYDSDNVKGRDSLLDNVTSFIIVFNFFFGLLLFVLGPFLFKLLFEDNDTISFFPLGLIAVSTGLISPFIEAYSSFVKNQKSIIKYGAIKLTLIISSVFSQIILIYNYQLEGALWAKFIANLLTALLVVYFIKNIITFRFNRALLKKYLKYSIPLIPFFFIFWLGRYADRFILERHVDLAEIGLFGLLMTFAGLVTLASQALANSIQPFLFEEYKKEVINNENINSLISFYVVLLFAFCSVLLLIVCNIKILSPRQKYLEVIPYFYLAILPTTLNAFQYVFFNIFTFHKKSTRMSMISLVSVFIQLFLLIILIGQLKIYGAILASFIGNLISFMWYYIESRKYLLVNYNWKKILPIPVLFILLLPIAYTLGEYNIGHSLVGLLFPIPIMAVSLYFYRESLKKLYFKIVKH